ncbi:hypothetical protein GH714_004807 [Hevea brasiliensis]|uniref:Fold protein n=1 Tax=Hevea brasiliensis TaxID=3981 RepID=A0A6A6MA37_HEVBR|nr:hypothetical protein GH714_004807 [Hevea brasiliensis]
MALAESSNLLSYSSTIMLEDEDDHDTDDGYDNDHQSHPHNLSRLSVCTSSMYTIEDDDCQDCDRMRMFVSRLSFESFDADEELSNDEEGIGMLDLSLDSDEETGCYSLPATPPRHRNSGGRVNKLLVGVKEYASENEAQKGGGLVVITRPKGGRRSLCMDMEEVKACRDLGFELEHERMLEMPGRVSLSGSTLDTSSGGNSPIANWRISSPGDDPREVKARLKVWAQAVALASASRHCGI